MKEIDTTSSTTETNQAENNYTKRYFTDGIGFVELMEVFGNDLTVANAARVSFNKESAFETATITEEDGSTKSVTQLPKRDVRIINFLAKHKHITPFFHPQVRFRIKMPIFIAREWYRHTIGFARNEVSRRYIATRPECFVPSELRARDKNIKQGSSDNLIENNNTVVEQMRTFSQQAIDFYEELLEKNVCPEQARMVLPQSMHTEFIETASLSAYARLVGLRVEATAQKEIQDYGRLVSELIEPHFPVSWKALCDNP